MRWNPSRNANKFIRFDEYYQAMPQRIMPVLHGCAPMMYNDPKELHAKPLCPPFQQNVNSQIQADPWLQYAMWTSLFAARYAGAPAGGFPTDFETIAAQYVESPDNQGLGRGLVKHIEIFNEPDRAWYPIDNLNVEVEGSALDDDPSWPTKYYFRPREYAAMLSAAYDGNKKANAFRILHNGQTVGYWGIKNLSSNTKIVLAGTADTRHAYLDRMRTAWDNLRGPGDYPFDILNFHFYSTADHPQVGQHDWSKFWEGRKFFSAFGYYDHVSGQQLPDNVGKHPESGNISLKERLREVTSGISNVFGGKPIWITEFGYDAFQNLSSGIDIQPFGTFETGTIQGQWITRYILETSAVPAVGKLFIYELTDDYSGTPQFSHSGLTWENGNPKKSWFHVSTLMKVLGETHFADEGEKVGKFYENGTTLLPVGDPRIYRYEAGSEERPTFALWVPTG